LNNETVRTLLHSPLHINITEDRKHVKFSLMLFIDYKKIYKKLATYRTALITF